MDKIEEVIYLPTLRCNLNCKHCEQNQDVPKSEELDCLAVLKQIERSILLDTKAITITGGEPFLNPTLPNFILTGLQQTSYRFNITTNGYLFEEIANMVEGIALEDRGRLHFAISIDGLKYTHNAIRRNSQSFDRAVQTVKYLVQQKLSVNINTVVQESNLHKLSQLAQFFQGISSDINHEFISITVDISEEKSFVYTDQYQSLLWPYTPEISFRKKHILSKGKYLIQNCHAGKKNIVIGPDGKVYACLTGAYYRGKEQREAFMLGDLKQSTLDEILLNKEKRDSVYIHAVKPCAGCSNHCEVDREIKLFNGEIGIAPQEISDALRLEKKHVIGSGLLDYAGWYTVEEDSDGRRWCWSTSTAAKVFVPSQPGKKWISLSYSKIVPELKVKVFLDGAEVFFDNDTQREKTIRLSISELRNKTNFVLLFLTDSLYSPSKLFESTDLRELGVCLLNVFLE